MFQPVVSGHEFHSHVFHLAVVGFCHAVEAERGVDALVYEQVGAIAAVEVDAS